MSLSQVAPGKKVSSFGTLCSTKGRQVNDLPKSVKVTERGILWSLPKQKSKPDQTKAFPHQCCSSQQIISQKPYYTKLIILLLSKFT